MGAKPIYTCQCEMCQSIEPHPDKEHHRRMNLLLSRLDEQQRRWCVGVEAERIGHGGTERMAQITGMSVNTIRQGRRELAGNLAGRPTERVRLASGGRKPVEIRSPDIEQALEELVADEIAGDPTSPKCWVRASLRRLAEQLNRDTNAISRTTVRRLLKKQKVGLVSNRKSLSGPSHPERDRQFRYIKRVKKLFRKTGRPILSIDAKNKELIGPFFNKGRIWRKQAELVNSHDFRQDALAIAVPFGIYDLLHNHS